jgi:uncharacterized protein YjbI with pentapeptide repeats
MRHPEAIIILGETEYVMNTKTMLTFAKGITTAAITATATIIAASIGTASERRRRYSAETISDTTINCAGRKRFYGKRFVNCNLKDVKVLDRRYFEDCTFARCVFESSQPTECTFINCTFVDCTFRNVHFLKCTIDSCHFINDWIVSCDYDCGSMNVVEFINCDTADCSYGGSTITNYSFHDCRNNMWRNYSSIYFEGRRYVTVTVPNSACEKNNVDEPEFNGLHEIHKRDYGNARAKNTEDSFNVTAGDAIINGVSESDIEPMAYDIYDEDEDPSM